MKLNLRSISLPAALFCAAALYLIAPVAHAQSNVCTDDLMFGPAQMETDAQTCANGTPGVVNANISVNSDANAKYVDGRVIIYDTTVGSQVADSGCKQGMYDVDVYVSVSSAWLSAHPSDNYQITSYEGYGTSCNNAMPSLNVTP